MLFNSVICVYYSNPDCTICTIVHYLYMFYERFDIDVLFSVLFGLVECFVPQEACPVGSGQRACVSPIPRRHH
jgi:hypothetical protein